jgi:nicotinamide-nucleotide amidase
MAAGALRVSGANIAVAVSGVAGPDGGSAEKPVGTVWFCAARRSGSGTDLEILIEGQLFGGDREAVRRASVRQALELILQFNKSG